MYSLTLTDECIDDCSRPGQAADDTVEHWFKTTDIGIELEAIPVNIIARHLAEYGAWSTEELTDIYQNYRRLLWIAACDLRENGGNEYYL